MATKTSEKIKNQLKAKENQEVKKNGGGNTIATLIRRMEPEIKRALPKHITPERMARITLTAIRNNPELAQAEQMSLLSAVMQSAQLGLEPNTPLGEAYLIPYQNKKKGIIEVQFQMGYKGLLNLAHRTKEYKAIYAHEVYQNDEFHYEYGLNKDLKHIPADIPEGDPIYYYAVYHLQNGGFDFVVWSREKVQQHAKTYSQAFAKGWTSPWKSDFDSMAKKTVLKDVLKYAPKSIEFAKALSTDETIKKDISEDMTEVIDVTDWEDRNQQIIEAQEAQKEEGEQQNE